MKISDFIFKFKSFRMRREGLCRVRIFINSEKEKICVLTDINNMSNMPCLEVVCDTVIRELCDNGYVIACNIYVLHDEFDNSMLIVDKYGNIEKSISQKELEFLTECKANDPFIDNKILKPAEYIKREIEIQENAISKKRMKELIESGASETEIAALLKSDLSLIAEVYAFPQDEYIVFSEFTLGDKKVDFVIFSGRSTMDVTFIEVKGAEFNLKKRSHYDSLNAKIEEANSQIRNHRKYIYNEYDIVRENLHNIREKAQSGQKIYNAFLAPKRELLVDSNKNVNMRFVIIAGRTPENDLKESDLRYQFGINNSDVELFSWNAWIRRLRRD